MAPRLRAWRRFARGDIVIDGVVGLVLAALAIAYLTYAMLRPERF